MNDEYSGMLALIPGIGKAAFVSSSRYRQNRPFHISSYPMRCLAICFLELETPCGSTNLKSSRARAASEYPEVISIQLGQSTHYYPFRRCKTPSQSTIPPPPPSSLQTVPPTVDIITTTIYNSHCRDTKNA